MPLFAWFILILWRVLSWTGFILLLITLGLWCQSYWGGFDIAHTFDKGVNQSAPNFRVAIGSSNGRLLITSEEDNDAFEDNLSVNPRSSNPWLIISANELSTRFNWTPLHSVPKKTFLGYGHEHRAVRTPRFEPHGIPDPSRQVREIRTDDIVIPYALCAGSFALWPLSNLLIWFKRKRQGRCPHCGGRRDRQGNCTFCARSANRRPNVATRLILAFSKLSFVLLLLTAAATIRAFFSTDRIEIQSFMEEDPGGLESRAVAYRSAGLKRGGLELFERQVQWDDEPTLPSWRFGMTQVIFDEGGGADRGSASEHFSFLALTVDRKRITPPVSPLGFYGGISSTRPVVRSLFTPPPSSWTRIVLPWYLLLTLFTLLSTPWFISLHHRRQRRLRKRKGQCPTCGYDLRATPGRCPECGDESKKSPA